MIAGYTKFTSDRLFSTIVCAYKTEDVFTTGKYYFSCFHEACWVSTCRRWILIHCGENLLEGSTLTSQVYASTTTSLLSRHMMEQWSWKSMRTALVEAGGTLSVYVIHLAVPGVQTDTYKETQMKTFSAEKLANMITVYDCFITPDHRPDYLLPSNSTRSALAPSTRSATTSSASQSAATVPGPSWKRKQSKCSMRDVMVLVTKNPAKWAQGHTTKAGCPLQKQLA